MKTNTLVGPLLALMAACSPVSAQNILSRFPDETESHEGTWLTWPHHYTYGTAYRNSLDATWVAMTKALVAGERVHIIAYNAAEQTRITNLLNAASVAMSAVNFVLRQSDDVWVRDNGPMFVFDNNGALKITDWGFDGWGDDTAFAKDDTVPTGVSSALNLPRVNLANIVLEGGAIEHDGHGTALATRSSILDTARNPGLTQVQLETALRENFAFTKVIWLDGAFGAQDDITDMHCDGFMRFAPGRKLVTMSNADLTYWGLTAVDITRLNASTDSKGQAYSFVRLPLTAADVKTTAGNNLGYKGSYANYYVANNVVLVPAYNDANDAPARSLLAPLYPGRTVVGIDVRNLYENGGMVHCVTQQQPSVPLDLKCSAISAGTMSLNFRGNPTHTYRLQSSTTLLPNSWTDVETFTLSGQSKSFSASTTGASRKFYRVSDQ
jgi:agmatine deiminase